MNTQTEMPYPFDMRAAGPVSTFPTLLEMTYPSPDESEIVSFAGLGEKVGGTVRHLFEPRMLIPMALGAAGGWYGRAYLPKKLRGHAALTGAVVAGALAHVRMTAFSGEAEASMMAGDYGAPTLREGYNGDSVRKLQNALMPAISPALKGSSLGTEYVKKTFGPSTKAYVQQFQRSRGLKADGIVGVQTWAALGRGSKAPQAAPQAAPQDNGLVDEPKETPKWVIPTVLTVGALLVGGVVFAVVRGGRS